MQIIFTEHAKERLNKRRITIEEVELALKSSDKTRKEGGKYIAEKNIGRAKIELFTKKINI